MAELGMKDPADSLRPDKDEHGKNKIPENRGWVAPPFDGDAQLRVARETVHHDNAQTHVAEAANSELCQSDCKVPSRILERSSSEEVSNLNNEDPSSSVHVETGTNEVSFDHPMMEGSLVECCPPSEPQPSEKPDKTHGCSWLVGSHERASGWIHSWLGQRVLAPIIIHVAEHPLAYIISVLLITVSLVLSAMLTGSLQFASERDYLLPKDAYPEVQYAWIDRTFSNLVPVNILIHASGANVLHIEGIGKAWEVTELIPSVRGYSDVCGDGDECTLTSVTNFWATKQDFQHFVAEASEEDVLDVLSSSVFVDGRQVSRESIFGKLQVSEDGRVRFGESLRTTLLLPSKDERLVRALELNIVDGILQLQEKWDMMEFKVDIICPDCIEEEFQKAFGKDLPLVAPACFLMGLYCALVFFRCRKNANGQYLVSSHGLLGVGAAVSSMLSIAAGYSFCSLVGKPVSYVTQALVFVLVGIGVDDAFILFGAFNRTRRELPLSERLRRMAEIAGPSIFVTSLTDVAAFGMGALCSTMPAIRIAGFYAVMSISFDFVYQITFFVALMVLDQRRLQAERRDYIICCKAKTRGSIGDNSEVNGSDTADGLKLEKIVRTYAKLLLHPMSKAIVLAGFAALLALGAVSASQVTVNLDPTDLTPMNSYIDSFISANEVFFSLEGGGLHGALYIHGVDMMNASTVDEVYSFIDELQNHSFIMTYPCSFWLDDFLRFIPESSVTSSSSWPLQDLGVTQFSVLLDDFLGVEKHFHLHGPDIVRDDDTGDLLASRVFVDLGVSPIAAAKKQVQFLEGQRELSLAQAINHRSAGKPIPMFLSAYEFIAYENYRRMPDELTGALLMSTIAVSIISYLFLPHVIGAILVVFVVIAVNVELVGVIHAAGFYLNTITVFLLIMAIGLIIDYSLHIIHSYCHCPPEKCQSRNERAEHALVEMGLPVFLGGFTTFLGVICMAFATSHALRVFFILFSSMIALGLGHGLVFAPVALSLIGSKRKLGRFHQIQ